MPETRAPRASLTLCVFALVLLSLPLAPPSLRGADERTSLLGGGLLGGVADNAARAFSDDASYYLVLAAHVAGGQGPTLDGRHVTDGFHPLWLSLLVPLAALASEPRALVLGVALLQTVLVVAAALLVMRTLRARVGAWAALLGACFFLTFASVSRAALLGLEWSLHAFLFALLAALWQRDFCASGVASVARCARLGSVLALLFLARLDTLPLAALLVVTLAWRGARGRRLVALALPVALAVVTYAVVTRGTTGHVTPVSAAVKGEWSRALLERDVRRVEQGWAAAKLAQLVWPVGRLRRAFWMPLALGTIGFALACLWPGGRRALADWRAFAVFAWLQWWALALRYHDGYSFAPWYFVAQPWLAALLVATAAQRFARRPAVAACACVLVGGFALGDAWRWRARAAGEEPLYAVARALREHTPAGARVGAWNAGQIALLSGRVVTNLDGLVNSWEFFEHERHDLCAYLQREGITYLADSFPAGGAPAMVSGLTPCVARLRLVWARRRDEIQPPRLDAVYALDPGRVDSAAR